VEAALVELLRIFMKNITRIRIVCITCVIIIIIILTLTMLLVDAKFKNYKLECDYINVQGGIDI
jgi:hypothetical protein